MKSKSIYLIVCIILLSCFAGCVKEQPESPPRGLTVVCDTIQRPKGSYEICESLAMRSIHKYKNYITKLSDTIQKRGIASTNNTNKKLTRGVKIDIDELYQILHSVKGQNNELYGMFSVMPSDSTEVIFALKSVSNKSLNEDWEWSFFDFTHPCPTSCPNFQ
ncbi:MAG: hypothetical protein Aureis2KO_14410 [Aureisphaera sp.]